MKNIELNSTGTNHVANLGVLIALLLLYCGLCYWLFEAAILNLVGAWNGRPEYSHGMLVPIISAFLIWQKQNEIRALPGATSKWAVLCVFLAASFYVIGELTTVYLISQYALLFALYGLALMLFGLRGSVLFLVPILILVFMIPLPNFWQKNLSAELQLISSEIGVLVIRAMGISVLLEGNIIDLGTLQLQVAEACNGLRYLFPLMTFGFLVGYFLTAPMWFKILLFLSTIPITVLMNSLRIGAIGILVEYWGIEMAQGFIHDFEGWIVFMLCLLVLFAEVALYSRFFMSGVKVQQLIRVDLPENDGRPWQFRSQNLSWPLIALMLAFIPGAYFTVQQTYQEEMIPNRASFFLFPNRLDHWQGQSSNLTPEVLNTLKLEDYLLMDYHNPLGRTVNFYVAYYESQRKGESAHSPRTCLPGGGWDILSHEVKHIELEDRSLPVNRVVMQMGENRNLVYYWFDQRGRNLTNEYWVKLAILWDSLFRHRSDGALVRLVTDIRPGEHAAEADQRLQQFMTSAVPKLENYIPH